MSQISQKALVVAFFLFYVLYAIVLLNLFIGIVTDVYPRAAERSTAQWEASITALMEVRTLVLLDHHKCFTWVLPPGRGSSKAEGPPQPRLRVMVEVASVLPTVPANTTRRGGGCDHCVRVPCSCSLPADDLTVVCYAQWQGVCHPLAHAPSYTWRSYPGRTREHQAAPCAEAPRHP